MTDPILELSGYPWTRQGTMDEYWRVSVINAMSGRLFAYAAVQWYRFTQ